MLMLIMLWMIIMIISIFLMFVSLILSKKNMLNQEKSSPFECGFDPLSFNRLPFSIQFFLISLVFIVFDIEIALLMPVVFLMNKFSIMIMLVVIFFLIILLLGLYYEYIEKSIDWKL